MALRELERREQVDHWLASGGVVLASSERSARSLGRSYASGRQAEGRTAWLQPSIHSWNAWVREQWQERQPSGVLVLNSLQEQALWSRVIARSQAGQGLLNTSRLAASAQQAYRLVADFAPDALRASARGGWTGDAATFSGWMAEFEAVCRRESLIPESRLASDLVDQLKQENDHEAPAPRAALLLAGFDRLTRTQHAVLETWGTWERLELNVERSRAIGEARFLAALDARSEMAACLEWIGGQLAADPQARLMIVTPGLRERRGELERALLGAVDREGAPLQFEFSLGVPLGRLGGPRAALMLLRWLDAPLPEAELDWLMTCGHAAASEEEERHLAETMRELRRRGRERPEWTLRMFLDAGSRTRRPRSDENGASGSGSTSEPTTLPTSWTRRMLSALEQFRASQTRQGPMQWASVASRLLDVVGWPGFRKTSSIEYQASRRWTLVLEECASLGYDGTQMDWREFVSALGDAVGQTIFAAESADAAVQVTEPLESSGQLADGIWFLGADEESWPGRGSAHPLLPIGLQREAGMPHASPQADWSLALEVTQRLLGSAEEVVFSYARQAGEAEHRPSRLVTQRLGAPIAGRMRKAASPVPSCEVFEDWSQVGFPAQRLNGGAGVLTRQSLCPFQAFGTARLGAELWAPAETGLNALQRGKLLHAVLHRVWGGEAKGGIGDSKELAAVHDLRTFVMGAVEAVMSAAFDPEHGTVVANRDFERFSARFLQLETERLTRLVVEWLRYEQARLPFRVEGTEVKREVTIAGVHIDVRLDRVDELPDGSRLILDYKSSDVGPSAWRGERPDDVQLPLYATYAVLDPLEGLAFGRIRPGNVEICGRLKNAATGLRPDLSPRSGLKTDPLTDEQLEDWRSVIERLGSEFVAGHAEVDPKDPGKTCTNCHLHAVCRIYEQQPSAMAMEGEDDAEGNAGQGDTGAEQSGEVSLESESEGAQDG